MNAAKRILPHVAAFFDLDGTLLGPPSLERRFLRYLHWRGALTAGSGARWFGRFLRQIGRGRSHRGAPAGSAWLAATAGNKAHLAGIRAAAVEDFSGVLGRRPLAFFPHALERLEWHAAQRHRIFLVSGTLAPLAKAAVRQLPFPAVLCATQLEEIAGRWTGELAGEAVCGPVKARVLERLAAIYRLDLGSSYAYGDAWNDRWMLERVGRPAAVNPSARLARLARRRGWPVLAWREAGSPPRHTGTEIGGRRGENDRANSSAGLAPTELNATGGRRK